MLVVSPVAIRGAAKPLALSCRASRPSCPGVTASGRKQKRGSGTCAPRASVRASLRLWQLVRRLCQGGVWARHLNRIADIAQGISVTQRALRYAASGIELHIRRDDTDVTYRSAASLPSFQRPFIDGALHLAEVVNAGIGL